MTVWRSLKAFLGLGGLSPRERSLLVQQVEEAYRALGIPREGLMRLLAAFHKRYDFVISQKGDEAAFLKEERVLVSRTGARKDSISSPETTGHRGTMVAIFDKIESGLDRYPRSPISENAFKEIECLYGALTQFEKRYSPHLEKAAAAAQSSRRSWSELQNRFSPFVVSIGKKLPSNFEVYREKIRHLSDRDEIQKKGQMILREAYVLLKDIRKFSQDLRASETAAKRRLTLPGNKEVFISDFALAVIEEINQIFKDFRLKGLES